MTWLLYVKWIYKSNTKENETFTFDLEVGLVI